MSPDAAVFDCHQHYGQLVTGPDDDAARPADWAERERSARLDAMDELGIGRSLVMPANDYPCPDGIVDTRRVNDGVRAYIDNCPARFPCGFGIAEPRHGAAALIEIRRCADELALDGIQYHCRFQGVAIDHPWMFRHLEVIGECGLLAFIHSHADSRFESTLALGRLAAAFPDFAIVVLDACSGYHHSLECLSLAERHDNLLFDTALAYNLMPVVEIVGRFGAHRVLFGSDIYSYPHRFRTAHTPAAVRSALGDAADLVLGGNLDALLEHRAIDR